MHGRAGDRNGTDREDEDEDDEDDDDGEDQYMASAGVRSDSGQSVQSDERAASAGLGSGSAASSVRAIRQDDGHGRRRQLTGGASSAATAAGSRMGDRLHETRLLDD